MKPRVPDCMRRTENADRYQQRGLATRPRRARRRAAQQRGRRHGHHAEVQEEHAVHTHSRHAQRRWRQRSVFVVAAEPAATDIGPQEAHTDKGKFEHQRAAWSGVGVSVDCGHMYTGALLTASK